MYDYDRTNKESIEQYARKLLNRKLSDFTENDKFTNKKSKGRLGQAIEEEYFGYEVNSRKEADFNEAGVELKVCPLKQVNTKSSAKTIREKIGYSAKERMVLSLIDYCELAEEEWNTNTLMKKCKELLLMFYMHEKDEPIEDHIFKLISLWTPSEEDLKIIKNDWNIIVNKVKAGQAHEISEGDTMYLGACTKGSTAEKSKRKQPYSNELAKQRAFCYKRSYVDYIIEELLQREELLKNSRKKKKKAKRLSDINNQYDEKIFNLFNELCNKSLKDIIEEYEIKRERKAKNYISLVMDDICVKVFGDKLDNFEEFKKAGIEIKTIVLKPNGTPKESMSFEQIDFCSIAEEEWEDSTIRNKFENKKHLWIVFQSAVNFEKQSELDLDDIILKKVMFWNMPISDLEGSMHRVWEDTVKKIKAGDYDNFIKISDGEIAHIRPKGRNSEDLMITPQGTKEKRKCFWLNAKYLKEQIEK